jgi:hypothetical protein
MEEDLCLGTEIDLISCNLLAYHRESKLASSRDLALGQNQN